METFVPLKQFVSNPAFPEQRARALETLRAVTIDAPITDLMARIAMLPYCFTLQSCHGHFVYADQRDSSSMERLPLLHRTDDVEYHIAYVALCLDNCEAGETLLGELKSLPCIDPEYVQFGCATWFWNQQVNSFALQVEPERFKTRDVVVVDYQEALHLQQVRDDCYAQLGEMIERRVQAT